MLNYLSGIWQSRYFWSHLSLSDLRARWRRSFFGVLWSVIQPLGLTLLLAVVFGKIFKMAFLEYAPYILSGMLVWEFVTSTAIGGATAFIQADAYIKQCRHPLVIYTLRTTLTNLMVFIIASTSLIGWILITNPAHFGWTWFAALMIYPIAAFIAWPLATLFAYISTRFRDMPHALGLIFQAIWFISPIYFQDKIFKQVGLEALVDYNPVYHLLEIVRAPLLQNQWPAFQDYGYCLLTATILWLLTWAVGVRAEKRVIFYL